jgi:hypothetical protein
LIAAGGKTNVTVDGLTPPVPVRLATKASFNFIPAGMMDDCISLEAEDRGHAGTLMFCERDTKFPATVWTKVKNIMEDYIDEESKATPHLIGMYNNLKSNLKNKVKDLNIPFKDISKLLMLPDGTTDPKYIMDDIHLSQKALPLILNEFSDIINEQARN